MKASQRRVPGSSLTTAVSETLRCFVVYGFLTSGLFLAGDAFAERGKSVHDYAKVYVDQYFEPDSKLVLSEEGKKKSAALANYALGRSLEARGRALEAVEAYKTVLENAPGQHFLARKTANLLARNGGNDEALELLEENLKANPDEPFAYISLSEYLATYRNSDEEGRKRSFSVIEDALQKFPSEAAIYEHYVRLLVVNNRKGDARQAFSKMRSMSTTVIRSSGSSWEASPVRSGRSDQAVKRMSQSSSIRSTARLFSSQKKIPQWLRRQVIFTTRPVNSTGRSRLTSKSSRQALTASTCGKSSPKSTVAKVTRKK